MKQASLEVRKLWNHRCSVTGSTTKVALEASHIKRWADSNDIERLDPDNGLLLTANLHITDFLRIMGRIIVMWHRFFCASGLARRFNVRNGRVCAFVSQF
jgi:hypothetical protein